MPPERQWLSWLDTLHALSSTATPTEADLDDCLTVCFQDETWGEKPEETDLYAFLAQCWVYPALRLKIEGAIQYWSKERKALLHTFVTPYLPATQNGTDPLGWRSLLTTKKDGSPTCIYGNVGLVLANHEDWAGAFWWDDVRQQPMCRSQPVDDACVVDIAQWLCTEMAMGVSNSKLIRDCIVRQCQKAPKDLLQTWIHQLPAWDKIERLDMWLGDVADMPVREYEMAVSRLLPVSMIARALSPGCLYRYVVILEGAENTGKSTLVRALAGEEWYVELSGGLESKEAHMLLQGAWVAEMAELDSLSRTEETRLKAFITLTADSWIPKYSNFRITSPRRTVFIGTTNDSSYLKGETGNTRYLPVKCGPINVALFAEMREQVFAEALHYYTAHPLDWWQLGERAHTQAIELREERRIENVYEDGLREFLFGRAETSWQDIAENYLQLSKREWKDKSLQIQIASALKVLGYERKLVRRNGRHVKVWGQSVNHVDHSG